MPSERKIVHAMLKGAYTGDISASMLAELGCRFVILGHSERRIAYGETDEQICAKAKTALQAGLEPILCIGETSEQRRTGQTEKILAQQIEKIINPTTGLGSLAADMGKDRNYFLPMEPVWAIGARAADETTIAHAHAYVVFSAQGKSSSRKIENPLWWLGDTSQCTSYSCYQSCRWVL